MPALRTEHLLHDIATLTPTRVSLATAATEFPAAIDGGDWSLASTTRADGKMEWNAKIV